MKEIQDRRQGDIWKVVELMKQIVPEYKSKNSVFEKLDNPLSSAGTPYSAASNDIED